MTKANSTISLECLGFLTAFPGKFARKVEGRKLPGFQSFHFILILVATKVRGFSLFSPNISIGV